MADAPTTYSVIPAAVSEFYDKTLLARALPLLVHDRWGQRRPIPKHNSGTIKFRRYESLAASTSPLTEGNPPDAVALSKTDITATLNLYGGVIKLTDKVQLLNVEPVLVEATELCGEWAGNSLDQIYRDVLVTGTNVIYANGKTDRNQVVDVISAADLDKAITTLKQNNARMFTEVIAGQDRHNTTPIAPAYFAIVHPHLWKTLKGLSGFTPVHKYPNPGAAVPGEIGSYEHIRFVETTNAKIWAGAGGTSSTVRNTAGVADVYAVLIFGRDAYGITELEGEGLRTIIKPLGSAGTSDPLDMWASVGWKAYQTIKILNDAFMVRIECAAAL